MTIEQRLERDLPAYLGDIAMGPYPEYIDDVLTVTAHRRQRPSWTFPERWLPMDIASSRVPTTRLPWRQLGILALIAILVAMLFAAYVGTRTPKVPAPFGPAANGLVAATRDGDLFAADPRTGQDILVLGGPENDEWVGFTPDGTRGVFVRWGPDNGGSTAAKIGNLPLSGGGAPVFIEKDVIHSDSTVELAPNGRDVAFTAYDYNAPQLRIHIAALDGSAYHQFSDVPITDFGGLTFLAPDGRELVYLARSANTQTHDIRALDVTTGETRPIVETTTASDIFGGVSASPDGKRLAYALRDAGTGDVAVHVIGTDGRGDAVVGHAPGATFEAWPMWDPQGRRLLIERNETGGSFGRPVIVDLAGGPDVVVQAEITSDGAWKQWAPDGSSVLAQRTVSGRELSEELWDAATGTVTPATWKASTVGGWQRAAP
jgi:WD40-like Beta Propeller Repeat